MKQIIHVRGGSSIGYILERLYAAGAREVKPGQVDQVKPFVFGLEVDWPEHCDQTVREAIKTLVHDYDIELH